MNQQPGTSTSFARADHVHNVNANANYHLLKLLVALGIIDDFILTSNNTFVPLKTTWRTP